MTENYEAEAVEPEAPVEETPAEAEAEAPAEEEVDPSLFDYREVAEGVQARVMTDSERSMRAAS
jgi:hypothetical protein